MLKRLAFVLVVCSCVGIAYGAAVKIKSFLIISEPNPDADGMAILNYVPAQNETILQLMVSDFEPNRASVDPSDVEHVAYDVILVKPDGTVRQLFKMLHTDQHGHGTLHWTVRWGDFSDADIEIYLGYMNPYLAEELRAVGVNPN